jgi:hypothetical protein
VAVISLGLHAVLLVIAFAGLRGATRRPRIELTPIQIVEPPPPPPVVSGGGGAAGPSPTVVDSAGAHGRRGRDTPQRSQIRAPAQTKPFAELAVRYDAPSGPDPGHGDADTGTGLGATLAGTGTGASGTGGLDVPPAPGSGRSRARPPRPKLDYERWGFRAPPQFAGAVVKVELTLDASGSVRAVRLRKGVDPSIDQLAIETAWRFAFYPALDDDGEPTPSRYGWEFLIEAGVLR